LDLQYNNKRLNNICQNVTIILDKRSFNIMSNTDRLMQQFLRKMNSVEVQEAFEILGVLLELLETKDDPEPFEIHFVDGANQVVEKLNLLEGILKDRLGKTLIGNKLQNLYEKTPSKVGSQIIFD